MTPLFRRRSSSVSTVVAVKDANAVFLDECLAALAGQQRTPDEVVLAVSGSGADTSAAVTSAVESASGAAWSLLVVEGDADEGVRRAAGGYLMVIEAGDVLAPGAVQALAASLDETGSDLALPGRTAQPSTTLESVPEAAASVDLAVMMLRDDFWQEAALRADPGPVARWLPAVQAVMRASAFDVVSGPVRRGARRGTGVPFNAMLGIAPHLRSVLPDIDLAVAELGTPALAAGRGHLVQWLVTHELSRYLEEAEGCDAETWQLLADLARRLLDGLPVGGLATVPVEARVRAWLGAAGRRAELEQFNTTHWHREGEYATEVRSGRVFAVLSVEDVPEEVLELSAAESCLVTQLRRARWTDEGQLALEVVAYTRRVGSAAGPARVQLALVAGSGQRVDLDPAPVATREVNLLAAERHHDHADGLYRVLVDPALLTERPESWSIHVAWERAGIRREGEVRDVERRGSVAALEPRHGLRLDLRTGALESGSVEGAESAAPGPARPEVTGLALEGDVLVVSGTAPTDTLTLRLRGPRGSAAGEAEVVDGGFVVHLPLRHDPWRLGPTPLPPGSYRLRLQAEAGPEGPGKLVLAREPAARTPYVERSEAFRMRVERNLDGSAQVVLAPPLAEDEAGAYAQGELRRWYATDERRIDPRSVYLQAYAGTAATDSPLAIHRELRRRRPDLRLVWGAVDASVAVPEGAERVVFRSRAWYDAVATSGRIVTNTDMDEWFCKRPGQRLLQTFHGYPAKAMGVMAWEAKNFTPSMIERHLRRTSATWDLVLTPHPSMDVHYREQYRYTGPILSGGYPRDDELVGPDAGRLREETRRRLRIGGRTAVLFAPTWRDDLATNFRAAVMPSTLDVEAAAEALGEDYVILLRGHRFHRQRPEMRGRLLDVTGYPEINHLILAADAAVLDYSSLRFDMALTRRPLLFLVPDLDRYETGVRGFLYDFRTSAPGPLLETTAEVVDALRNLDGVAGRFAEDYDRFHQQFNALQDGHSAERVVAAFFGDTPPQG